MEIVNAARHTVADFTIALDKTGREYVVLAIKATYRIPVNDRKPRPLIPAQPLLQNDLYVGDPATTAPLAELDFCLHKPKCDVVFNASAHSPNGKPVMQLFVGAIVATMKKQLHVTGNRFWIDSLINWQSTDAVPFISMPLHYGRAFGGLHQWQENDKTQFDIYRDNIVGSGYAKKLARNNIRGMLLPNLTVAGQPINSPSDSVTPVALSALPRNNPQRINYAGTYDDKWRKNDFPFLPQDFDDRYFQSVPVDQQIDYPKGGEQVILLNMMQGRPEVRFKLPRFDNMPVQILLKNYEVIRPTAVVDTLYFEPDESRFSAIWRVAILLKRTIGEIDTISIGPVCKDWWGKKKLGLSGCSSCRDKKVAMQEENAHEAV